MKLNCETQTYTWRGKSFLQMVGLPFGPRAISAIARIVMNKFDAVVGKRMSDLGIKTEVHARYIDDIRAVLRCLKKASKIVKNKIVVDKELAVKDEKVEPEIVTARLLVKIMDNVFKGIKFTSECERDFPSEQGFP